ncbi:MAG: DNA translocase FtsK, partial [Planctomycetes bacterium]|nr:DNA translocase FtsK [Planctomycetota bacterium]
VLTKPAPAAAPIEFASAGVAAPPAQRAPAPFTQRAPASLPPRAPATPPQRPPAPAPRTPPTADHATPKFTPASAHAPATVFRLPSLDILDEPEPTRTESDDRDLTERMMTIEGTLRNFDLESKVVSYEKGPVVTLYELELAPGIRVHKIVGMADDLAIALKAPSVRIIAPIPGKGTIGIEVPNAYTDIVRLKDLCRSGADAIQKQALPLFLGKDAAGVPIIKDLTDMPHLLIAGTTGSGKSVCLNAIIMSLLLARKPDDLRILLIDPKMVELSAFKEIPHLLAPVVTEMKRAPVVLEWLVRVMEERYALFARVGVKKIDAFNALGPQKILERVTEEGEEPPDVPTHLPYMVVILDELADMMMVSAKDVESLITRLAQKSRAVGVHMVLATQRPSVDVITGLIKSNMPARIAFKVASKIDSRTILDRNGAERLLGRGDMLWLDPATSNLMRAQCTYVADKEIRDVVKDLREQGDPVFDASLLEIGTTGDGEVGETDELFDKAVRIILETQRGSVSLLQRRLEIGYTRAARLVDMMGKAGIVGDYKGSKAREVLTTLDEWVARHGSGEDGGASSGDDAAASSDERIHPGDSGPSQAERMREDGEGAFEGDDDLDGR